MRQCAISALSNCDSLAVVVAHFDLNMAGRQLMTAFVFCRFGLSYAFSKTNFTLIQKSQELNLFVHSLHLQSLINVNIAF